MPCANDANAGSAFVVGFGGDTDGKGFVLIGLKGDMDKLLLFVKGTGVLVWKGEGVVESWNGC